MAAKKPNILIIWGDDIGWFNISAYNHGIMGYKTPNIDRIAREGALFTDWYGQQSCTAGRAAFITGQSPNILKKIGPKGIDAATRITGFFVAAMGMGLIFHGIVEFLQSYGIMVGRVAGGLP